MAPKARRVLLVLAVFGLASLAHSSHAQGWFDDGRLVSKDGNWKLPVKTITLSSNSSNHRSRGAENALDLSTKPKSPVYAVSSGEVIYAGCDNRGNRGCQVWIRGDDGFTIVYAHLLDESRPNYLAPPTYRNGSTIYIPHTDGRVLVSTGDRIEEDDVIGRVWKTGMTAWYHLHFVVFENGVQVEPERFFDTSLLTTCLRCEALEWDEDAEYNPPTLRVQNQARQFSRWLASLNWADWVLLIGLLGVLGLVLINVSLLIQATGVIVRTGIDAARWSLYMGHRINRQLERFWWGIFLKPIIYGFLSAAVMALCSLAAIISANIGYAGINAADAFTNELLRRVPFRGVPNHSEVVWLPDTVAYWWPEITEASQRHGVEPELLAFITIAESCGNPEAGSGKGALGLTQVMPGTGQEIASQRDVTGFTTASLYDPEVNLDFGAYYLAKQLDAFGSVKNASGAYNGGPGRMMNHLDSGIQLTNETLRYQEWITGFWNERSMKHSPTLDRWLTAGGQRLCDEAQLVLSQYPAR